MKPHPPRLARIILAELDGLDWSLEVGGKHWQLRIGGHLVAILPHTSRLRERGLNRGDLVVRSNIRRWKAREARP